MSERGSFTTQYFYGDDYKVVREALDQNDKYLCVSPPAAWSIGEKVFEMPIVSGKAGSLWANGEWDTIASALEGVVTNDEVRVVVMCDAGAVVMVTKSPDGRVQQRWMTEEPDEVEVKRCVGCKHYDRRTEVCHNPRFGDGWANYPPPSVNEDFFCADWAKSNLSNTYQNPSNTYQEEEK